MTAESHSANRGSIPRGSIRLGARFAGGIALLTFPLFILGTLWFAIASAAIHGSAPALNQILYSDSFDHGLDNWIVELERGGSVTAQDGKLEIDVPAGCTVWFKRKIDAPVLIEYEATAVAAGGTNDRVSDLNCFWMARDSRSPDDLFATARTGRFAEYDRLRTYYVGQGGNGNTTARFRRYIGEQDNRPLLPEHDLRDKRFLLEPNAVNRIQLVARDSIVQYFRDGNCLFDFKDSEPYTSGWFGFRTTKSHLVVRNFRVNRVAPATQSVRAGTSKPVD